MYHHTHNGLERTAWPDGGSYFEQYILLIDVWDVIGEEIVKDLEIRRRRGG
jgi:hypothetical protein